MKNLSIFEPQIEKHHAYKKTTCNLLILEECSKVSYVSLAPKVIYTWSYQDRSKNPYIHPITSQNGALRSLMNHSEILI